MARLPEYVELGGDLSATYVYVANSHDGSMAVTAAVSPIRIVCANSLGAALRQAEHGVAAQLFARAFFLTAWVWDRLLSAPPG